MRTQTMAMVGILMATCGVAVAAEQAAPTSFAPVAGGFSGNLAHLSEALKKGKDVFQAEFTSTLDESRKQAHEMIDKIIESGGLNDWLEAMGRESQDGEDFAASLKGKDPQLVRTALHSRLDRKLATLGQQITQGLQGSDASQLQGSYTLAMGHLAKEETHLLEAAASAEVKTLSDDIRASVEAEMEADSGAPAAPSDSPAAPSASPWAPSGQIRASHDHRGYRGHGGGRGHNRGARRQVRRQTHVIANQQRVIQQQQRQIRQQQRVVRRATRASAYTNYGYGGVRGYNALAQNGYQSALMNRTIAVANQRAWFSNQLAATHWNNRVNSFNRYLYGRNMPAYANPSYRQVGFPGGYYYRPDRVERVVRRGLWGAAAVAATPFALVASMF